MTEANAAADPLETAKANVEAIEKQEAAVKATGVIMTREQIEEERSWQRQIRLPMVNAFLDMRVSATGNHRLDAAAILELDTLREMVQRARGMK